MNRQQMMGGYGVLLPHLNIGANEKKIPMEVAMAEGARAHRGGNRGPIET